MTNAGTLLRYVCQMGVECEPDLNATWSGLKDFVDLRSRFDGVWSTSFELGSFEGRMVTEGTQRAIGTDAPP